MLSLRKPWTRQPWAPAAVNWGDPITYDLAFLAPLHPADGGIDLVTRQRAQKNGTLAQTTTRNGLYHTYGTGSYVDFPQLPAGLTQTTPVTFAWTQEPRGTSGYSTVLNLKPVGATNIFLLYQSSTDLNYYWVAGPRDGLNSTKATFSASVGAAADNVFDRYVFVSPGGTSSCSAGRLWRNGVAMTIAINTAANTFGAATAESFRIGALETGGDPFEGVLGNFHIWRRALTPEEAKRWSTPGGEFCTLAPRRMWALGAGAAYTLTGATYAPASITSDSVIPRVTWTEA